MKKKKDFSNIHGAFVRHLDYVSVFRLIKRGRKEMSGNVHPANDYSLYDGVFVDICNPTEYFILLVIDIYHEDKN